MRIHTLHQFFISCVVRGFLINRCAFQIKIKMSLSNEIESNFSNGSGRGLVLQSFTYRGINFKFHSFLNPIDRQLLISGNEFAKSLGYKSHTSFLHALNKNKDLYVIWSDLVEDIRNTAINNDLNKLLQTPKNWQPGTILINITGINLLLIQSRIPFARELTQWICKDVLPNIYEHGQYTLKKNASTRDDRDEEPCSSKSVRTGQSLQIEWYAQQMTEMKENYSRQIVRYEEERQNNKMQIVRYEEERQENKMQLARYEEERREDKLQLRLKDAKCEDLTNKLCASNVDKERLKHEAFRNMRSFMLYNLLADDNIKANEDMVRILSTLEDRVIPVIEKQHQEPYLALYKYLDSAQNPCVKVVRGQLHHIESCSKNLGRIDLNKRSDQWKITGKEFFRVKFPNSVALWNNVKEKYPHSFYGMETFNTNVKILTEEELLEKFNKDLEDARKNEKFPTSQNKAFLKLNLKNADEVIVKCFIRPDEIEEVLSEMFLGIIKEIEKEIRPSVARRDTLDYTDDDIKNFFKTNFQIVRKDGENT